MLWTEIKSVVTRDGKTYQGTEVREWLKQRGVLPDKYVTDLVKIHLGGGMLLRTREEVSAWLTSSQLCQRVELLPVPQGDRHVRHGARGIRPGNPNHTPTRVEFVDHDNHKVIERVALTQGAVLRVSVRVAPAPRTMDRKLELAFVGAKIRERDAIRSVLRPSSGYRYLSRVRVTRHRDGLHDPIKILSHGAHSVKYPRRDKGSKLLTLAEFTLLGLEGGVERIQACLVNKDETVECSAVLEIAVTRAARGVGALRVFHNATPRDYKAKDPEFDSIYTFAPNSGDDVRVGVFDSGVYDDRAGEAYLSSHWEAGRYFDDTDDKKSRDTQPSSTHSKHMMEESPSLHGTNVAGQAVWGSPRIKLLDIMVQRGQETSVLGPETVKTALKWGRDSGASVINCSKAVLFGKEPATSFVAEDATTSKVLFLATGGNDPVSFPLNTTHGRNPYKGQITYHYLPTSMVNTLWGGGCTRERTPHASRGHGPAIEVMVPSDDPPVYSPKALRAVYRAQNVLAFRTQVLVKLADYTAQMGDPPAQLPGTPLDSDEQGRFDDLDKIAKSTGFNTLNLQAVAEPAYKKLLAKSQPRANPKYLEKQAYIAVEAELRGWPVDDLVKWGEDFFELVANLGRDTAAARSRFVGIRPLKGEARGTLANKLQSAIDEMSLRKRLRDLEAEQKGAGTDVATDDGVSFGLPVLANIAAKLKLIDKTLTPNEMKRILIDTSDIDPGFETQCIARGIVNPLRAYLAAFDRDVSTGGQPHHGYAPEVGAAPCKVYYTFFYMDAQGAAVCRELKDRLRDSFAQMDIDLVEAEPPVRIKSEPLTYVEGRALMGHTWRKVVPVQSHPLIYAPRHLRLILVNQCACPQKSGFGTDDLEFQASLDPGTSTWAGVLPDARIVFERVSLEDGDPRRWSCAVKFSDQPAYAALSFVVDPEHIVTKFMVYTDGDTELDDARPPHTYLDISRTGDRSLVVTVKDPAVNQRIADHGRKVGIQFGVVQRIGGARIGGNIFVNNNYHAGPSGTSEATNSAFVLFQHEIGHALGMVPATHAHYYHNNMAQPDRGFGGDGEHCSFNTEEKSNDEARGLGVIGDGRSGRVKVPLMVSQGSDARPCVMYHTRTSAHHKSRFCDECKRVLKGLAAANTWAWND